MSAGVRGSLPCGSLQVGRVAREGCQGSSSLLDHTWIRRGLNNCKYHGSILPIYLYSTVYRIDLKSDIGNHFSLCIRVQDAGRL